MIPKPEKGSGKLERQMRASIRRMAKQAAVKADKAKAAKEDKAIRLACYLRDHRRCRAFSKPLLFSSDNLMKMAHNHHIVFRSQGGSDTSDNRITLSWAAHQMAHGGLLEITGNADTTVTFTQYEFAGGTRKLVRTWESAV